MQTSFVLLDNDDRNTIYSARVGLDFASTHPPSRVTETCRRFALIPGCALDLHTGWDFTLASRGQAALNQITREAPLVLVGSPPCTWIPLLRQFDLYKYTHDVGWLRKCEEKLAEARMHIECGLHTISDAHGQWQMRVTRTAPSLQLEGLRNMMKDPGGPIGGGTSVQVRAPFPFT